MTVAAADLERLLADLLPIGRDEDGRTTRLAWTREDEAAAGWFARRAQDLGRRLERDEAGNLWACPDAPGPWWAVGSHLDSVPAGAPLDGALGVAAGFAVAAVARAPVAVVAFADSEGARFDTPNLGSRALAGTLDVDDALDRTDEHGVLPGDAMAAAGADPERLADAPARLERLRGVLELHVDPGDDVAAAGRPAGVALRAAAHLRLLAELDGTHDALAAAARLIVRADAAAAERLGLVFAATRLEAEPSSPATVPTTARAWLDVRGAEPEAVAGWRTAVEAEAARLAEEAGIAVTLAADQRAAGCAFPGDVRDALLRALPPGTPRVVAYGGHDAAVLTPRLPAGLLLVRRDPEGELEAAATAATAAVAAIDALAPR